MDQAVGARDYTVDDREVAHFDSVQSWWDPRGEARWLHRYNPVRVGYIRDRAAQQFGRDPTNSDCLSGLRLLDIGCGAGVLCEPLARLGADVVGADPARTAIDAARVHARESGLQIDYRCASSESLADAGERFDIVLAMEVIEHVSDPDLFIARCAEMVRPGGLMILSTLNRTVKSFVFAIAAAEYVLRLLPRGAHQWSRFLTPAEVRAAMARHDLAVADVSGVTLNLFAGALQLSRKTDVNYILTAERRA
jgi:2-polyprenyl-6-hydroxyphenyl methylase/3-demethylubiquinone-9 3-methyltransferase